LITLFLLPLPSSLFPLPSSLFLGVQTSRPHFLVGMIFLLHG
jgi:hypothetical protein